MSSGHCGRGVAVRMERGTRLIDQPVPP